MDPYLLWIPSSIMIILVVTVFVGVTYGAYPPLQYGPYYIYPVVFVSYQRIQIYSPLIILNDKKLNPRFVELQMQTLFLINYLTVFIVSILGATSLAPYVLAQTINLIDILFWGIQSSTNFAEPWRSYFTYVVVPSSSTPNILCYGVVVKFFVASGAFAIVIIISIGCFGIIDEFTFSSISLALCTNNLSSPVLRNNLHDFVYIKPNRK